MITKGSQIYNEIFNNEYMDSSIRNCPPFKKRGQNNKSDQCKCYIIVPKLTVLFAIGFSLNIRNQKRV